MEIGKKLSFQLLSRNNHLSHLSAFMCSVIMFLVVDGSSVSQSAFLFKNTGFFSKLSIVGIARSTMLGPLSVNREI